MTAQAKPVAFYGWRVAGAAFIVAIFGWGLGFYGPPVYLHAVRELRGWSLALVSTAVTAHFLLGAIVVANLPKLYRRLGVSAVTKAGAVALGTGVTAWAVAQEPWQLLAATVLSGAGWAAMGAAAVNQIVSPWFIRTRPAALSMAYNGASVGGIVFSPLWVAAIALLSFPVAALAFLAAAGTNITLLWVGVILFGAGIGNATSLPPLIAQVEFTAQDVPRVVALIVAIAQSTYAFAPAAFGLMRELALPMTLQSAGAAPYVFAAAALVQVLAMGALLAGRRG
jgi:hypothetical protein